MKINENANENIKLVPEAIKLTGRKGCRFKCVLLLQNVEGREGKSS